jgi:uncharacterized lipoprotein YajG
MHKTLDNIKKLKHLILIVAILIVASCSQPRKEFAIDSSESKAALKADLELTEADVTKEVHYWLEDDSSSVAYFKTD